MSLASFTCLVRAARSLAKEHPQAEGHPEATGLKDTTPYWHTFRPHERKAACRIRKRAKKLSVSRRSGAVVGAGKLGIVPFSSHSSVTPCKNDNWRPQNRSAGY